MLTLKKSTNMRICMTFCYYKQSQMTTTSEWHAITNGHNATCVAMGLGSAYRQGATKNQPLSVTAGCHHKHKDFSFDAVFCGHLIAHFITLIGAAEYPQVSKHICNVDTASQTELTMGIQTDYAKVVSIKYHVYETISYLH